MDIIKKHIIELLEKGSREDGRKLEDYRKINIKKGVIKKAEGSARVEIGDTVVLAGIKMSVGTPFPDTPDEGTMMVNVELQPLASANFELGAPGIDAIELSRVTDRAIRESHAIDLKKLCIKKEEEVWSVFIDIYPLNDDGNLFDACAIAAVAALKDAKMPVYKNGKVDYEKHKGSLPLNKLPLSCTIRKIGNFFIVDPNSNEEEATDARLTVGILEKGDLCSLQKGGDKSLSIEDVEKMIDLAIKKTKEIRKLL